MDFKIDKSNMRQMILDFPKQFPEGIKCAKHICLDNNLLWQRVENIIICGMGGSGLPGDILVTLQPLDIFAYKDYGLPLQAGNESLIICISYSGNTEEVISSFQEAIKRRLPLISITRGGKLAKLSKQHNVPLAKIPPPYIPPRLALGYQFGALIKALSNLNLVPEKLIQETIQLSKILAPEKLEAKAKKLAQKVFKKIPIIYSSRKFKEVGMIWKNSLNETAKILAICNYFPELNHNETVGFWKINERQISNKKLYIIILRDVEGSQPRLLRQMEIAKKLIEKEGVKVEFVDIEGKNMLEKIFSSVILGYWLSYYLAILYGVDPTPVETIIDFKKKLAKNKIKFLD